MSWTDSEWILWLFHFSPQYERHHGLLVLFFFLVNQPGRVHRLRSFHSTKGASCNQNKGGCKKTNQWRKIFSILMPKVTAREPIPSKSQKSLVQCLIVPAFNCTWVLHSNVTVSMCKHCEITFYLLSITQFYLKEDWLGGGCDQEVLTDHLHPWVSELDLLKAVAL